MIAYPQTPPNIQDDPRYKTANVLWQASGLTWCYLFFTEEEAEHYAASYPVSALWTPQVTECPRNKPHPKEEAMPQVTEKKYKSVIVPTTAEKIIDGHFYAARNGLKVTVGHVGKTSVRVNLGDPKYGSAVTVRKESALVLSEFFANLHEILVERV